MPKITKQNVGGTDYTMVGCALTGVCPTSASDYVKAVTLSDGDIVSDGMTVACTFANGNTAGIAPGTQTIYSSDQVNYYSDDQLTVPFTLAPAGCYVIEYTGTGNAYTYTSYPVIQVGQISGPLCSPNGKEYGGTAWSAGDTVLFLYTGGKFLMLNVAVNVVQSGNTMPVTSGAVANSCQKLPKSVGFGASHKVVKISLAEDRITSFLLYINGTAAAIKNTYLFQSYGTWASAQTRVVKLQGLSNIFTVLFYVTGSRELYIDITNTSTQTITVNALELTPVGIGIETVAQLPSSGLTQISPNNVSPDCIPITPSTNGAYNLQCTVASGVPSYLWSVVGSLLNVGAEISDKDLNSIIQVGMYAFNDTDTNTPSTYGVLIVLGHNTTNTSGSRWINQLAFGTDGNIYFRKASNPSATPPNNWTAWKAITMA